MQRDFSKTIYFYVPASPLELDSVKDGVPSVWVGVDPSTLWGGVHVTVCNVDPRPDVLELLVSETQSAVDSVWIVTWDKLQIFNTLFLDKCESEENSDFNKNKRVIKEWK